MILDTREVGGKGGRLSIRLFVQSSELGPPSPHMQASLSPPPLVLGGTHSLAVGGVGGQFGRGDRHFGPLGIYVFCGV
jgi:hypothetical protein